MALRVRETVHHEGWNLIKTKTGSKVYKGQHSQTATIIYRIIYRSPWYSMSPWQNLYAHNLQQNAMSFLSSHSLNLPVKIRVKNSVHIYASCRARYICSRT
jgi:hypothetical protein